MAGVCWGAPGLHLPVQFHSKGTHCATQGRSTVGTEVLGARKIGRFASKEHPWFHLTHIHAFLAHLLKDAGQLG